MIFSPKEIPAWDKNLDRFASAQRKGVAHGYVLVGPSHLGKRNIAAFFIRSILCNNYTSVPCGQCGSCRGFDAHPDMFCLEGSTSNIEKARQAVSAMSLRPLVSKRKILFILDLDKLSSQSLNALLKFIEEPPESVVVIATAVTLHTLPATILSRLQYLRFSSVPDEEIERLIKNVLPNLSSQRTSRVIAMAAGLPAMALELATDTEFFSNASEIHDWHSSWIEDTSSQRALKIEKLLEKENDELQMFMEEWFSVAGKGLLTDPNGVRSAAVCGKLLKANTSLRLSGNKRLALATNLL